MSKNENLINYLMGFGISVGALSGIFVSFISRGTLSSLMSQGIAGGILTASLISVVIKRSEAEISQGRLFKTGMGAGTLVGCGLGLLSAWIIEGNYLNGALIGSGIGLVGGTVLMLIATYFLNREQSN